MPCPLLSPSTSLGLYLMLGLGLWGFPSSAFSDSKGEQSWAPLWKVSGTPYCPHPNPLPGLPPLSLPQPLPGGGSLSFRPLQADCAVTVTQQARALERSLETEDRGLLKTGEKKVLPTTPSCLPASLPPPAGCCQALAPSQLCQIHLGGGRLGAGGSAEQGPSSSLSVPGRCCVTLTWLPAFSGQCVL